MQSFGKNIGEKLDQAIEVLESETPLSKAKRRDIANRLQQAKQNLKKITSWIEVSQKLAEVGAWEYDAQEDKTYWSSETYRILDYNPENGVTPTYDAFIDRVHPEDRERVEQAYAESLETKTSYEIIYRLQLPDGGVKYVQAHMNNLFNEVGEHLLTVGANQDVTERELEKKHIEQSLEENQTLLGEIHHRVKNNLAVVVGMLQLQWLQEDDPDVIKTLRESANRMKAVAGIHQQLYETGDFADLSLGENIKQLAANLISTMTTNTTIDLVTNCDSVHLSMRETLPCTLIANEVVTNSIKHAFEDKRKGEIAITLTATGKEITLTITDNGKGLPEDFDTREDSLGMNLIETLSNQLDAEYTFRSSQKGTTFILRFQEE